MKSGSHILYITPGFPKDEDDFLCIPPLQEFLIKFKSTYPETQISVIAFQYPYEKKEYDWNGIKVYSLAGRNNIFKKLIIWQRAIELAKQIDKIKSINVIHSFWLGECALIGNFLSKKLNCKHICTLMGQDVKNSNWYLKFLNLEKILIVALSKIQADLFYKNTNKKVDEIISWGINDQQIESTKRNIDLLAVGSLIPIKNYSLLIKIVEIIAQTNSNLKCVLVGSGPEEIKLKSLSKEKKLENNIEFAGILNRKEVFKLMQRSKILVHTSIFEGSAYVFAEALVNGMNIISYEVGGVIKNPKWFTAKEEMDFVNISINLLSGNLDFNPVNPFPITKTLSCYADIYETN
jgi:glycosyltransferase involved in cell wall biosynthesis